MATKMKELQDETVVVLLREFDNRLPLPHVATRFRAVFDFRLMPLEKTQEAQQQLLGQNCDGGTGGVWAEKELRGIWPPPSLPPHS